MANNNKMTQVKALETVLDAIKDTDIVSFITSLS